ncbi:MAG: DivIVA domain-containing protein [Bacilli bacterium]|jgi:DivIVA domain-containing protein|nr:DivIVA domain-containing protein [Bacilli bacterium]
MAVKLLLDSNKIYHKVFEGTKPGYDALQVDTFLDIVIKDYDTFASYVVTTDQQLSEMQNKVDMLNEQLSKVEAENASLKARLGDVSSNEDASLSNLELLRRISKLEKALSKAGINPNTIDK